jgi:hypothetical protein
MGMIASQKMKGDSCAVKKSSNVTHSQDCPQRVLVTLDGLIWNACGGQ